MEIMVGTMMRHRQCGDLSQELPIMIEKGRPAALLLEGGISGAEPCDPSMFVRMPLAIVAPEPALLALCRSGRPRIEAERGNIEVFRDGAIGLFQLAVLVDDEVLHERGVAKLCFELGDRHLQFFGPRFAIGRGSCGEKE